MADWYFGSYPRCGFEKYLVKPCKLQLIDTIEKAQLLVFKDLRTLSNSLSLRVYNFHTAMVLDSFKKRGQHQRLWNRLIF